MGSICDARRAGMPPARSAATSRTITANAIATGSFGFIPNKNDATNFDVPSAIGTLIASPRRRHHDHLTQHHPHDRAALRAQRHANPDLTRAPRHRVRNRPVEPDAGDRQRQHRQGGAQFGEQFLRMHRALDLACLRARCVTGRRASAWCTTSRMELTIAERIARRAQRIHHLVRLRECPGCTGCRRPAEFRCSNRHSVRSSPRRRFPCRDGLVDQSSQSSDGVPADSGPGN